MMGYFGSYGLFGGLGMGIGMIVWIALIALLVWALVSFFSRETNRSEVAPIEILNRRYAMGEISQAEFEQAKAHLG